MQSIYVIGRILYAAIFIFLLPITPVMHAFWKLKDPSMRQVQQVMFMKNTSLACAALMIMCFSHELH